MRRSPVAPAVAVVALLEACFFLYMGYWWTHMFHKVHAPPSRVITGGLSDWLQALALVAAAAAYWREERLRPWLQICAVLAGLYGFVLWAGFRTFPNSWDITHGDIAAMSAWSMLGLMLLAVLAVADFLITKLAGERRRRPFRT